MAAFLKTVFLFGVPRLRPPRRSPGLDPLGIATFANFRIRALWELLTAEFPETTPNLASALNEPDCYFVTIFCYLSRGPPRSAENSPFANFRKTGFRFSGSCSRRALPH